MVRLETTTDSQTFPLTTRVEVNSTMDAQITYRREGEESTVTVPVSLESGAYFVTATATFSDLEEGMTYIYTVDKDSKELHRGEFLASSDVTVDYSVNTGAYTTNSTSNDYIILD